MRGARIAATLMTGLALATPAAAGEPTDTLRLLFDRANRILSASDVTDDARLTALRTLVREAFDARAAAALALGHDWTVRTAAERDEFSRLYADVLEAAYLGGVGSRARLHGDGIRVAFASESVQGTSATVVTTLETRSGGEMPIEYRLTRRDAGWAVVDVVVEGLSLARSYRAQIQRVLQHGSYADLVARLREKASTTTLAAIAAAKTAAALLPRSAPASPAPAVVPASVELEPPSVALEPPSVALVPPSVALAPASVEVERARAPEPTPPSLWLQVGAFRDTEAASRLVERLRDYGAMVVTQGRVPLARVLVGPFTNRAAAVSALRELAAGGYRAFIAVE